LSNKDDCNAPKYQTSLGIPCEANYGHINSMLLLKKYIISVIVLFSLKNILNHRLRNPRCS